MEEKKTIFFGICCKVQIQIEVINYTFYRSDRDKYRSMFVICCYRQVFFLFNRFSLFDYFFFPFRQIALRRVDDQLFYPLR